ncbi:unnamed protein product, partial [Polarella glacialis]
QGPALPPPGHGAPRRDSSRGRSSSARTGAAAAVGRALVGPGSRPPSLGRPPVGPSANDLNAAVQSADNISARQRSNAAKDSLEDLLKQGGSRSSSAPTGVGGQGQRSLAGMARVGRGRDSTPKSVNGGLDFDQEARTLFARLNLDPSIVSQGPYNALDPLWRHPQSGGIFYVGNQTAAATLGLLQKHGITHVVNCTDNMPCYHENNLASGITYNRFDITSHYRR